MPKSTQPLLSGLVAALSVVGDDGGTPPHGPSPVTLQVKFANGQECQGTQGTEYQWNDCDVLALAVLGSFNKAQDASRPVYAGAVMLEGKAARAYFWDSVDAEVRSKGP